jgi:RNA polymerase sigma-70 factor, ECF subfamily
MASYPTALSSDRIIQRPLEEAGDAHVSAQRTDRQLVDLVLAGDQTAFEQIFDRHKRLVAAISSRYFRRPEEIDELIQISFAKAYTEMGSFRGEHERSFASWLVRITSNACFDVLRSQRRKPERLNCDLSEWEADSLMELTADVSASVEQTLVDRDLSEKLLSGLPPEDRALLEMMYSDEMSVAEIADTLGLTKSNVKVRAWRARTSLRKVLRKIL